MADVPRPDAPKPPARTAGGDAALPDGGRRTVVVDPQDVWSASAASESTREAARRAAQAEPAFRAARRAFLGPIAVVVGLSTALMAAAILALAAVLVLRPGG